MEQVDLANSGFRNFAMECVLPDEIIQGAVLEGNEYAWKIDAFPRALENAPTLGYACLGGQFQCRLGAEGVYEMYWLDADPDKGHQGEDWPAFCERSCAQVLQKFEQLMASTDFKKEVARSPNLSSALMDRNSLDEVLVFCAYFITESEWLKDIEH